MGDHIVRAVHYAPRRLESTSSIRRTAFRGIKATRSSTENETIVSYGLKHATRLHRAKLVILAAAAKYVHGDRLPYPDVWYDDGRIAVSILKRLALICGTSLNVFAVGHDTPLGRVGVSYLCLSPPRPLELDPYLAGCRRRPRMGEGRKGSPGRRRIIAP
jgi:hypothetical protein